MKFIGLHSADHGDEKPVFFVNVKKIEAVSALTPSQREAFPSANALVGLFGNSEYVTETVHEIMTLIGRAVSKPAFEIVFDEKDKE